MGEAIMAEFAHKEGLLASIYALRNRGLSHMDAYTPYPVHEAASALALPKSPIPWIALAAGALGGALAYGLQWWVNVVEYPLNVGAQPLHTVPAFVPITFELIILFAGVTTFLAVLFIRGIPKLWDPVFEVEGFERATIDRYWLRVDDTDPVFDRALIEQVLAEQGALKVVLMEGLE